MERYRVRKFAEEKVPDDDDIIATMVMVSIDSGSETRAETQNFSMTFKY